MRNYAILLLCLFLSSLLQGCANQPCQDNSDCLPGLYCEKAVADCEGEGLCRETPEMCTMIYAPVCGCDGITYANACEAAAAGVNVQDEGEWEDGTCVTHEDTIGLCRDECGRTLRGCLLQCEEWKSGSVSICTDNCVFTHYYCILLCQLNGTGWVN